MAKKKYYAVRKGSETGLFETWEECRARVQEYPGAQYKSFSDINEAWRYLGVDAEPPKLLEDGPEDAFGDDAVRIYVDGSYAGADEFSYGMVVLQGGRELCFSEKIADAALARMHNVAGEIKGAEAAMQYALDHQIRHVVIYHDYEGIAKWCTREWKANKPETQAYRDFYDAAGEKVTIEFRKVKGHSKDKYNDLADQLAKQALEADAGEEL